MYRACGIRQPSLPAGRRPLRFTPAPRRFTPCPGPLPPPAAGTARSCGEMPLWRKCTSSAASWGREVRGGCEPPSGRAQAQRPLHPGAAVQLLEECCTALRDEAMVWLLGALPPLAGYSRVKLATHRETRKQYAVKIIPLPKRELTGRAGQGSAGSAGQCSSSSAAGQCTQAGAGAGLCLKQVQAQAACWTLHASAPAQQPGTQRPCAGPNNLPLPTIHAAGQSVNKYLSDRGAIMKVGQSARWGCTAWQRTRRCRSYAPPCISSVPPTLVGHLLLRLAMQRRGTAAPPVRRRLPLRPAFTGWRCRAPFPAS